MKLLQSVYKSLQFRDIEMVSKCSGAFHLYSTVASKLKLNEIVSEAKRIVDYRNPLPFDNLKQIAMDKVIDVTTNKHKLINSGHPVLQFTKSLFYDDINYTQNWGLVVLLLSKAAGLMPKYVESIENVETNNILHSQRTFAEATEMIKTGHLVHKNLMNNEENINHMQNDQIIFGNKIALLAGDYLLSTALNMISNLKNQHTNLLLSSALRDLTEAEFVGERTLQNTPIPSKPKKDSERIVIDRNQDDEVRSMISNDRESEPLDTLNCIGDPVKEWTMRNLLNGASLLGRGCEGALYLGGHDKKMQSKGYNFGCHVALAWQAALDVESFSSDNDERVSLVSAPILFALEDDSSLYYEIMSQEYDLNHRNFKAAIKKTTAIDKTMDLYHKNCIAAMKNIEDFPETDATSTLKKLINY